MRIGNGAADQYQADVIGEVMIALGQLRVGDWMTAKDLWAS